MLMIYKAEKRDPDYPNLPILKELGCPDAPALGYILVAPKGLPEPIYQKLLTAVKKVTDGEEFQKLLKHLDLPYDFKDGKAMEKDVAAENAWYKEFLPKMGAKVIK